MNRSSRKPTLWTLRKVSTRISLSMPRRLTWTDTFRLLWIFCFRNHYSIPLSSWDGMCRPGLACAGWSGSIHCIIIRLLFQSNMLRYISNYQEVELFIRYSVGYLLILSHIQTLSDAYAADNFWKNVAKGEIIREFSFVFIKWFQSRLLQMCCMWKRVNCVASAC